MQLMKWYRYYAILVAGVLFCSACSDESENSSTSHSSRERAEVVVDYSKIASCDAYFSKMQFCVDGKAGQSLENQEKLNTALYEIGQKMAAHPDQAAIKIACENALKNIDDHQKMIGC